MSKTYWWVIGALGSALFAGAAGCSSDDAPSVAGDGPVVVVTRTVAATAEQCPFGGSLVQSGLDLDGDGALGDGEIRTQTAVCTPGPADPVAVLVLLAAEPEGAHCALGGTAVESGADVDGDGVLAAGEITHVDYLCGAMLLSRMVSEPVGPHCAEGGAAIELGPDRNDNGALDDDEIVQTQYACGDLLHGDVAIHSAGDLAAITSFLAIEGTVEIDHVDLAAISLVNLAQVRALTITNNSQLTALQLPALRNGDLTIDDNPQLPVCEISTIFALDANGALEQHGNQACAQGGAR